MVGSFFISLIACGISQIIWIIGGYKLLPYMIKIYKLLFLSLIKKGWIKG
ncbi:MULTISPECIES: hypothetical protein [Arsenophonus]|nr:hypothetical protein [Candidatus Arsenophonus lipoptenae]